MLFRLTPGKAGLTGAFLSFLFLIVFVVLGFVQPGYSHLRTTISTLAVGEYGWIQTLNFGLLALSFALIGFGLGKNITHENANKIFNNFLFFAVSVLVLAMTPIDKLDPMAEFNFEVLSPTGRVHYFLVLGLILVTPPLLFQIINSMRRSTDWKSLVPYTVCILVFNFVVGVAWFYLVNIGFLVEWKGLIQKVLATNVLVWLAAIGCRLWMLENNAKHGEK